MTAESSPDPFELVFAALERDEFRILRSDMANLSESERAVRVVWELDGEVKNGGFLQYFSNPSGENAGRLLASVIAVGCDTIAPIVIEALSLFPTDMRWQDYDERSDCLDGFTEREIALLRVLDNRYYEHDSLVIELLASFIMRQQPHFGSAQH